MDHITGVGGRTEGHGHNTCVKEGALAGMGTRDFGSAGGEAGVEGRTFPEQVLVVRVGVLAVWAGRGGEEVFAMATGRGAHAICEECEELACSFGVGAPEPVMEPHGEGEVNPRIEVSIDLPGSAMLAP